MADQPKPPALRKGDRVNFNTLKRAFANGDAALMSVIRKSDNAPIAVICGVNRHMDGSAEFTPLAIMVEGNPYDLFYDPTADVNEETKS